MSKPRNRPPILSVAMGVGRPNGTTSTLTNLEPLTGPNGRVPESAQLNINDILYRTRVGASTVNSDGTIYSYDITTKTFTNLHIFSGADGSLPTDEFITDGPGNLFVTMLQWGDFGNGTVFELNIASQQLTTLFSFDRANGTGSAGALLLESPSDLFGTTSGDHNLNYGSVFELVAPCTPEPSPIAVFGFGALFVEIFSLSSRKSRANSAVG